MVSQSKKMQEKLYKKEFDKYFSRDIKEFKVFDESTEDFSNLGKASFWIFKNGYSYGSISLQMPIPIQIGSDYKLHEKWYNLSEVEKKNVDGVMLSDDFRNGIVKVLIFNK